MNFGHRQGGHYPTRRRDIRRTERKDSERIKSPTTVRQTKKSEASQVPRSYIPKDQSTMQTIPQSKSYYQDTKPYHQENAAFPLDAREMVMDTREMIMAEATRINNDRYERAQRQAGNYHVDPQTLDVVKKETGEVYSRGITGGCDCPDRGIHIAPIVHQMRDLLCGVPCFCKHDHLREMVIGAKRGHGAMLLVQTG